MDKLVVWTYNSVIAYSALVTLQLTLKYLNTYRFILPFMGWISIDQILISKIIPYNIQINKAIINTLVNTLHALGISLSAVLFIFDFIKLNVFEEILVISTGYFLYDILKIIIFKKKNKINLQLIFHHTIVLLNLIPVYKKELIILDNYYYLTAVLCISEFTTLPLNVSWTLYELNKKDTMLFKCSLLSTIILYIPCRLFTSVYTFYILYKKSYYNIYMVFTALFIVLNYYWFYKLITKLKNNS